MEWKRIEKEKVSAWVRRLGRRACIANGIAKLRRSPRVSEGKGRQETVSFSRGAEQADKTSNEKGKKRENKYW